MSRKAIVTLLVAAWQAVVYALCVGGIFPEIFHMFGIPWNSVGWPNFLGTAGGLLLLELPALILVAWAWRLACKDRKRQAHEPPVSPPKV